MPLARRARHTGVSSSRKATLVASIIEQLERERDVLMSAQRATQAGATHEENRAEGDKDTRATEASYLARGQAERVIALEADIARLRTLELRDFSSEDAIEAGALVTVRCAARTSTLLLVPAGAGTEIRIAGGVVRVVTPTSPLGAALLGAVTDDVIEVERGNDIQEWEVTRVE